MWLRGLHGKKGLNKGKGSERGSRRSQCQLENGASWRKQETVQTERNEEWVLPIKDGHGMGDLMGVG